MQKSVTTPQGFFIKRKVTTRNYQSVSIRKDSKSTNNDRLNGNKTEIRNTSSIYISKNMSTGQMSGKNQDGVQKIIPGQPLNTALNMSQRGVSKSAYRYKRLNFTQHKETKYQNYTSNSMKDFKRKNQRQQMMTRIGQESKLCLFLSKVQQMQQQFVDCIFQEEYEKSAEIIVCLLNYTVDLNLVDQFSLALKILADFYIHCGKINEALFYYNETRQSALLLSQPVLLIQSLIGIANCCSKGNLQKQAISILKKALEYSWYYDNKELQLQLYDEIGQKYYHLGDIDKAKKYHSRYVSSIAEPIDSAHKSLSKQRIKKNQEINIELKYQQLSIIFLVHLKIPIRSLKEVPPIEAMKKNQAQTKVRDHFNISKKYFSHFQDMDSWVKNILKNWFFAEEMDEPQLGNQDCCAPMKLKKFAYLDFKLNQHLKKFNSNNEKPTSVSKQQLQYKETLQEKIERKVKQPSVDPEWYEKMVQQIVRDHKNKLLNVRNAVRMRGYNKPFRPSLETLKQVYNRFFDKKTD